MPFEMPPREEKARYLRRKFDEIAHRYDLFNDLITQGQHRYWKRVLVNRLDVPPQGRVLDLCCGTGDIARRWMGRLSGTGSVVAADFSPNMLHIARNRLDAADSSGTHYLVLCGDALHLPFQDESFHAVTVGYGLRNVADLGQCLDEILRVLHPGGMLASLDLGKVRSRLLRPLADAYFFRVVPWIGRLLQPGQDMFTYLPHSSIDFPEQHELAQILLRSGFDHSEVIEFMFGASVIHLARK